MKKQKYWQFYLTMIITLASTTIIPLNASLTVDQAKTLKKEWIEKIINDSMLIPLVKERNALIQEQEEDSFEKQQLPETQNLSRLSSVENEISIIVDELKTLTLTTPLNTADFKTMRFHFVNEKFGSFNPELSKEVNAFLQDVWNEAVATNQKDIESINMIARNHLGSDGRILNENAKILVDKGLKLGSPNVKQTSAFDDTLSSIGILYGEDVSQWDNQTHPLLVLFHNYALEGSDFEDINLNFDFYQDYITFHVKSTNEGINPQDDFYTWTSKFSIQSSEDRWRMAVIMNGSIITQPILHFPLKNGGAINGASLETFLIR